MTHRRDLELHRQKLDEMRNIMNSMKALAYMESRKLATFIEAQRAIVSSIEQAADDFLGFYPQPVSAATVNVYLLIGSERGFCGDFNERLLKALPTDTPDAVMAIGHKLHAVLPTGNFPNLTCIDGASTAEEIAPTLNRIAETLSGLQKSDETLAVTVIYHDDAYGEPIQKRLFPPFSALPSGKAASSNPPCITLPPAELFRALVDEYLYAVLNTILCSALLAENTLRTQHLDSAVNHLDKKTIVLRQQGNALRQEEITEEIEIILLSAGLDTQWPDIEPV